MAALTLSRSALASTCSLRCRRAAALPARPRAGRSSLRVSALLGPDGKPGGSPASKKFISREDEPEQYWSSKLEAEGANPLKDPMALIGILAIFFPFIFLGIAIALGYVDISVYR